MDGYVEKALAQPDRAVEILAELRNDPFAGGLLISEDGKHSSVVIELAPDEFRSTESYPALIEQALDIFRQAGFKQELHRTGMIAIIAEVMHQTELNITRLFPIVCAVLLVSVFLMFRRLWPVAITGVVSFIGVIWTMGFAILLFEEINVLMAMVPVFIMIVSFSDVVHLCSSYLLELSSGEAKEQAIEKSCSEVGVACLYTSLTTFSGFVSLAPWCRRLYPGRRVSCSASVWPYRSS